MRDIFILLAQQHLIGIVLMCVISYLIGGLNFSIIVNKIIGNNKDIRSLGSGNAGFTNMLRSVGVLPAVMTFIGDFLKGVVAVFIGKYIISLMLINQSGLTEETTIIISQACAYISGFMCLLGHIYPCFYGFRGGKGVLTTWATTLLIDWRIFLIIISVFLVVLIISKIVSLSSISAAASFPITTYMITSFSIGSYFNDYIGICTIISLIMACVVIYKHKSNISRILSGTEKKISRNKS